MILEGLRPVLIDFKPHYVLVHGDTSTTFAASLAAYYLRIPVAHIEAGLRTNNIYEPWPEEVNRKLTSVIASMHFAPTKEAETNLLKEGHKSENIFVTGNTVIDALVSVSRKIDLNESLRGKIARTFNFLTENSKVVLVTGHRRENFGIGFERICIALKKAAHMFPDVEFVYPLHLNPNVREPVRKLLAQVQNIHLIKPLDYLPFVYLMKRSSIILTDSGGIQEEGPSLGKPVLVMRDVTERPEAVNAGGVKLVGTDPQRILNELKELLTCDKASFEKNLLNNPYGDGNASGRIIERLLKNLA
jgi:UDP-N-acetylglucosamine 2-epimerase (non-hydrolysing)